MENPFEEAPERIPDIEEVLEVIRKFAEVEGVIKESSDEQGLYLLDVKVKAEDKPGDTTQYEYRRKGNFPGGHSSAQTVLNAVSYRNGEEFWAESAAFYNPEAGGWMFVK